MIETLKRELVGIIGADAVMDDPESLESASRDGSHLSPILSAKRSRWRPADLLALPTDGDELAAVVAAAVRAGVAITPRGRGTANYGQTIPMAGGLVIDTKRMSRIHEVMEGSVRADAGVTMLALERAAMATGQQLLMFPSTVHSSLGGFLSGGSGGTGSIAHGMLRQGFVDSVVLASALPEPTLVRRAGAQVPDYLHRYGTVGIIAEATVRLEPAQSWLALSAGFARFESAVAAVPRLCALSPTPRLVSADPAALAAALPHGAMVQPGHASVRAVVDERALAEAESIIEVLGGEVIDVSTGAPAAMKLSTTSYNHAIEWLQRAEPGRYFHVEIFGPAVIERAQEIVSVYPGGVLHVEGLGGGGAIGLLAADYLGEAEVYHGFDRLLKLGVGVHNPHQWYVDIDPDRTRELARSVDPRGLLNPGKLALPDVPTRAMP